MENVTEEQYDEKHKVMQSNVIKNEHMPKALINITNFNMETPNLQYLNSIDSTCASLSVFEKYSENCEQVCQLQRNIMKQIIELRQRVQLIYCDMNAEMRTVFNVIDNQALDINNQALDIDNQEQ